jgi:hypothetical protein
MYVLSAIYSTKLGKKGTGNARAYSPHHRVHPIPRIPHTTPLYTTPHVVLNHTLHATPARLHPFTYSCTSYAQAHYDTPTGLPAYRLGLKLTFTTTPSRQHTHQPVNTPCRILPCLRTKHPPEAHYEASTGIPVVWVHC